MCLLSFFYFASHNLHNLLILSTLFIFILFSIFFQLFFLHCMTKVSSFSRVFFWKKLCLVSWFLVWRLVTQLRYSWQNYFSNNFTLLNDLSRVLWYFTIDNTVSKCIHFLRRHILQIVYQSTFSSEYMFFYFSSDFFTYQLHHYLTSTYHLNHYLSTSLLPIILDFPLFWALNLLTASILFPSVQLFLVAFGCCECWLPCMRLTLHYDRPW